MPLLRWATCASWSSAAESAGGPSPPAPRPSIRSPAGSVADPTCPAPGDGAVAVELSDGRVLVAGGLQGPNVASAAATIISADGRTARPVGTLLQARFKHAIVPWADGTVLVVGGTSDDRKLLDSTEAFDPRTLSFSPGPQLAHGRYKLTGGVTQLPDGRVVVAGGGPGAEVIAPGTDDGGVVAVAGSGVASFSTVSVVGPDVWFVGGYDRRSTYRQDRRVPICLPEPRRSGHGQQHDMTHGQGGTEALDGAEPLPQHEPGQPTVPSGDSEASRPTTARSAAADRDQKQHVGGHVQQPASRRAGRVGPARSQRLASDKGEPRPAPTATRPGADQRPQAGRRRGLGQQDQEDAEADPGQHGVGHARAHRPPIQVARTGGAGEQQPPSRGQRALRPRPGR